MKFSLKTIAWKPQDRKLWLTPLANFKDNTHFYYPFTFCWWKILHRLLKYIKPWEGADIKVKNYPGLFYYALWRTMFDVYRLFCNRIIFCGLRQRTVPELFFSLFPLSIKKLLSHLRPPPVPELFLHLQEFFKAVSLSKVVMDFILKILFLWKSFLCGISTYFLLVFTTIVLSG